MPVRRPAFTALRVLFAALVVGSLVASGVRRGPGRLGGARRCRRARRASAWPRRTHGSREVEARLAQLEAEGDQIDARARRTSAASGSELARQLEDAKRDLRQLAVTAYIAGGPAGDTQRLLEVDQFADSVWRASLIEGQADRTLEAAKRYDELLARCGHRGARARDSRRPEPGQDRTDEVRPLPRIDRGQRSRTGARAGHGRERLAAARAIAPSVADSGGGDAWAKLRGCESGGNYQAISPSGKYRGAYQFDQRTWEAVGGVGDPVDASPEEQDLRARILYSRSGARPWPVCGRYLP